MDARLRGGPAWRGGALGGILVAAVAIVAVVGLAGRQPAGAPPSQDAGAPASPDELPAGLENRSWVAGLGWNGDTTVYGAATLDGKASLLLPPSELGLTAADGRVVSMGPRGESGGSVLRVRDIASGITLIEISRPEQVEIAVLRGDSLFFTGRLTPVPTDPGVYRADLAGGPLTTLIESGPLSPEWDNPGRTVELSPSGRTLASGLCTVERCRVDVIDLTSGDTRLGVVEVDGFLRDITDSVAIAGGQGEIAGYDLTTGAKLWSFAPGELTLGYLTSDGRLVQGYYAWLPGTTPPIYTVATIDVTSGNVRVLFEDPDQGPVVRLWPEVSGDRFAVLGRDGDMASFFGEGGFGSPSSAAVAVTDLLDLETGELIRGRLAINRPK